MIATKAKPKGSAKAKAKPKPKSKPREKEKPIAAEAKQLNKAPERTNDSLKASVKDQKDEGSLALSATSEGLVDYFDGMSPGSGPVEQTSGDLSFNASGVLAPSLAASAPPAMSLAASSMNKRNPLSRPVPLLPSSPIAAMLPPDSPLTPSTTPNLTFQAQASTSKRLQLLADSFELTPAMAERAETYVSIPLDEEGPTPKSPFASTDQREMPTQSVAAALPEGVNLAVDVPTTAAATALSLAPSQAKSPSAPAADVSTPSQSHSLGASTVHGDMGLEQVRIAPLAPATLNSAAILYPTVPAAAVRLPPPAALKAPEESQEEEEQEVPQEPLPAYVNFELMALREESVKFAHSCRTLSSATSEFYRRLEQYLYAEYAVRVTASEVRSRGKQVDNVFNNAWQVTTEQLKETKDCSQGHTLVAAVEKRIATFQPESIQILREKRKHLRHVRTAQAAKHAVDRLFSFLRVEQYLDELLYGDTGAYSLSSFQQSDRAEIGEALRGSSGANFFQERDEKEQIFIDALQHCIDVLFYFEREIDGDHASSLRFKSSGDLAAPLPSSKPNTVVVHCPSCRRREELPANATSVSCQRCCAFVTVQSAAISTLTLEWASTVQQFRRALRIWLDRCCAALLKVSNLRDSVFLLRHLTLLQTVGSRRRWALNYLQFPQSITMPDGSTKRFWNETLLDHYIAMVSLLLQPVRAPERPGDRTVLATIFQALYQEEENPDLDHSQEEWILVENPEQPSDFLLLEEDFIALFEQCPHAFALESLFHVEYEAGDNSDHKRMYVRAMGLLEILGQGLVTFAPYRKFASILSSTVADLVQKAAAHHRAKLGLENGRDLRNADRQGKLKKVSASSAFDQLCFKAAQILLNAPLRESRLRLRDLPFSNTSKSQAIEVFTALYFGEEAEKMRKAIDTLIGRGWRYADWVGLCDRDQTIRQQFLSVCQKDPEGAKYNLMALGNLAASQEGDLPSIILHEVFFLSFLANSSNVHLPLTPPPLGAKILVTITQAHPSEISKVLKLTSLHHDKIPQLLQMFKGFPLDNWRPTEDDFTIIRDWLMLRNLGDVRAQLARHILEALNWGMARFSDRSRPPALFLGPEVHRRVAVLVVEAFVYHSALAEDQSKVWGVVNWITGQLDLEEWCWKRLLSLALVDEVGQPFLPRLELNVSMKEEAITLRRLWQVSSIAPTSEQNGTGEMGGGLYGGGTAPTLVMEEGADAAVTSKGESDEEEDYGILSEAERLDSQQVLYEEDRRHPLTAFLICQLTTWLYPKRESKAMAINWEPLLMLVRHKRLDAVLSVVFSFSFASSIAIAAARAGRDLSFMDSHLNALEQAVNEGQVSNAEDTVELLSFVAELQKRGIVTGEEQKALADRLCGQSNSDKILAEIELFALSTFDQPLLHPEVVSFLLQLGRPEDRESLSLRRLSHALPPKEVLSASFVRVAGISTSLLSSLWATPKDDRKSDKHLTEEEEEPSSVSVRPTDPKEAKMKEMEAEQEGGIFQSLGLMVRSQISIAQLLRMDRPLSPPCLLFFWLQVVRRTSRWWERRACRLFLNDIAESILLSAPPLIEARNDVVSVLLDFLTRTINPPLVSNCSDCVEVNHWCSVSQVSFRCHPQHLHHQPSFLLINVVTDEYRKLRYVNLLQLRVGEDVPWVNSLLPVSGPKYFAGVDLHEVLPDCPSYSYFVLLVESRCELPLLLALGYSIASYEKTSERGAGDAQNPLERILEIGPLSLELQKRGIETSRPELPSLYGHMSFESLAEYKVFRIAAYALATPPDDPACPLIWQLLFTHYFARVGSKFFGYYLVAPQTGALALTDLRTDLKRQLREKLVQSREFFDEKIRMMSTEAALASASGVATDQRETLEASQKLSEFYTALSLWMEEKDLNKWLGPGSGSEDYLVWWSRLNELPDRYIPPRLAELLHSSPTTGILSTPENQVASSLWVSMSHTTALAVQKGTIRAMGGQERAVSWPWSVPRVRLKETEGLFQHILPPPLLTDQHRLVPPVNIKAALLSFTASLLHSAGNKEVNLDQLSKDSVSSLFPSISASVLQQAAVSYSEKRSLHLQLDREAIASLPKVYADCNRTRKIQQKCPDDEVVEFVFKYNESQFQTNIWQLILSTAKQCTDLLPQSVMPLLSLSLSAVIEEDMRQASASSCSLSPEQVLSITDNEAVLAIQLLLTYTITHQLVSLKEECHSLLPPAASKLSGESAGSQSLDLQLYRDTLDKVVQKAGMYWFQALMRLEDVTSRSCPPIRVILWDLIRLTGIAFMQRSAGEAFKLLSLLLTEPSMVYLLGDVFNPSIAKTSEVLGMYESLMSSDGNMTNVARATLLRKFDFNSWLSSSPSAEDVIRLLRLVAAQLRGPTTNKSHQSISETEREVADLDEDPIIDEDAENEAAMEIFRLHCAIFHRICVQDLNGHFSHLMKILLGYTSNNNTNELETAAMAAGRLRAMGTTERLPQPLPLEVWNAVLAVPLVHWHELTHATVLEAFTIIEEHIQFLQRSLVAVREKEVVGVLPQWRALGVLDPFLSMVTVLLRLPVLRSTLAIQASYETWGRESVESSLLWQCFKKMFNPLLTSVYQPATGTRTARILPPWMEEDTNTVSAVLSSFSSSLSHLMGNEGINVQPPSLRPPLVLNALWKNFADLRQHSPEYVLRSFVSTLRKCPWEDWPLTPQVLSDMEKFVEVYPPSHPVILLAGEILCRANYGLTHQCLVARERDQGHGEEFSVGAFYGQLVLLYVKLIASQKSKIPPILVNFISDSGVFSSLAWGSITPESYDRIAGECITMLHTSCSVTDQLVEDLESQDLVLLADSVNERSINCFRVLYLLTEFSLLKATTSSIHSSSCLSRVRKLKSLLRFLQQPLGGDTSREFYGLSPSSFAGLLHEILNETVVKAPIIIGLVGQEEMMGIIREVVAFANLCAVDVVPLPPPGRSPSVSLSFQKSWAMPGWGVIKDKLSNVARDKLLTLSREEGVDSQKTEQSAARTKTLKDLTEDNTKAVGAAVGGVIWEFLRSPQLSLATLSASCRVLTSVRTMAVVLEGCIEGHLMQSSDWGPIAEVLEVPELSAKEFHGACMELASALTLYASVFQDVRRLKTPPSAAVLQLMGALEELKLPRGSEHKAIFLAVQIVHVCARTPPVIPGAIVKDTLQKVVGVLTRYGENRITASLMGALGLGESSSHSEEFAIASRAISFFLSLQVPDEGLIRLDSSYPTEINPTKKEKLGSAFRAMCTRKNFQGYVEHLQWAYDYIVDESHSLATFQEFVDLLLYPLFPQLRWLGTSSLFPASPASFANR